MPNQTKPCAALFMKTLSVCPLIFFTYSLRQLPVVNYCIPTFYCIQVKVGNEWHQNHLQKV